MYRSSKDRHRNRSYRQALGSVIEEEEEERLLLELDPPNPIDSEIFAKHSNADKFGSLLSAVNLLCAKVQQINTVIADEDLGLSQQLFTLQTQTDANSTDLADVIWENNILKGVVQRQAKQIDQLNTKVTQLMAKNMEKNILISGLNGDEKSENCKAKVLDFLKSKVEINVSDGEILVAHRKG